MAEGVGMAKVEQQPGFLHRTSTKIALAGSGLVLAAAGAIGVKTGLEKGGSSPENSNSVAAVPATPQSKEAPQLATPMPSLTPEATKVPVAATQVAAATPDKPDAKFPPPEAKKERQGVVSAELMRQAERVIIKTLRGEDRTYLGFKDLPPGTRVYSPVNGFFIIGKESGPQFVGSNITIYVPTIATATGGVSIRGPLRVDNIVQRDMKAGEIVGHTTGEKTLDGGYSLLFTITKTTPDGAVVDEEALREMAPGAYEKPLGGNIQNTDKPGSTVTFTLPPGAQPAP